MNPIEEQRQIIGALYRIVKGSTPEGASSSTCRFEYPRFDDGSRSVGSIFSYTQAGATISAALDRSLRAAVPDLVAELHEKMQAHTGGDWSAFTLTIAPDGRVTANFTHPD